MEDRRFTEFKGNFITDNLKNKTALVERAFKTGGLFSDAGYIWENVHNLETNECPECGEDCTPFFFFREDEYGDTIVKCTSCGCEFYEPEFKHSIKTIYRWYELSEFARKLFDLLHVPILETEDGYYWGNTDCCSTLMENYIINEICLGIYNK